MSGEGEGGWEGEGGVLGSLFSVSSGRPGDAEGVSDARFVLSFSAIDCSAADAGDAVAI